MILYFKMAIHFEIRGTTVASAIDKRVGLSFPVAGSIPFGLRSDAFHDGGDYEQHKARPIYEQCDYECMYLLR